MKKNVVSTLITAGLAVFAGAACAQSSLTIYGLGDISVDRTHRSASTELNGTIGALTTKAGNLPNGSAQQASVAGAAGLLTALSGKSNVTRVSPSGSAQTMLGFKGVEDIGGGLKASFVLEGQLNYDTGALGQDGRIFGRQAYVGLTTPYGEVRLGRQYAPIFYSVATVTTERLGATDLFSEGGATNNLQVRQDNQISYWAKVGAFTGEVAYSPNAGADAGVSIARASSGNNISAGQILGGATAGAETTSNRGRSAGMFLNYNEGPLVASFAYHMNHFGGATSGLLTLLNGGNPITFDRYNVYSLGAKYNLSGVELSAAFGDGQYKLNGTTQDPKLQSYALGVRAPVGKMAYLAQVSQVRFKNYTEGKDTGLMLGAEYEVTKRTVLYSRLGQVKDSAGKSVSGLSGGPDFIGVLLGYRELPVFAGGGITPGGRTSTAAIGVRHNF